LCLPVTPTTLEAETGRGGLQFKTSRGKKLTRAYIKNTSQELWRLTVNLAHQEAQVGGSPHKAGPGKKHETLSEK
jgi:hypothetical protein